MSKQAGNHSSHPIIIETSPLIKSDTVESCLEEGEVVDSDSPIVIGFSTKKHKSKSSRNKAVKKSKKKHSLKRKNFVSDSSPEERRRKRRRDKSEGHTISTPHKRKRKALHDNEKRKVSSRHTKTEGDSPPRLSKEGLKRNRRESEAKHTDVDWYKRKRRDSKSQADLIIEEEGFSFSQKASSDITCVCKETIVHLRDEPLSVSLEDIPLPAAPMQKDKNSKLSRAQSQSTKQSHNLASENGFMSQNDEWLKTLQAQAEMYARNRGARHLASSPGNCPSGVSRTQISTEDGARSLDKANDSRPTPASPSKSWANMLFTHQSFSTSSQPLLLQHGMSFPDHVNKASSVMQPFLVKDVSGQNPTSGLTNDKSTGYLQNASYLKEEIVEVLENDVTVTESSSSSVFRCSSKNTVSFSPSTVLNQGSFIPRQLMVHGAFTAQAQKQSPFSALKYAPSRSQSTDCRARRKSGDSRTRRKSGSSVDEGVSELAHSKRSWYNVDKGPKPVGSLEFTVMSYNILSQDLMDDHPYLYSKCEHMDWTVRRPALINQIMAHNADILCFQEVQKDHWTSDLEPVFRDMGYGTFYKGRTGDKGDGCAILYKYDKFNLIHSVPVEFAKGGILDRDNVGVILVLEPRPEVYGGKTERICVATTHLLFNPKRGDVKLAQLMLLLAEIDKCAYRPQSRRLTGSPNRQQSSKRSPLSTSRMVGVRQSNNFSSKRVENLSTEGATSSQSELVDDCFQGVAAATLGSHSVYQSDLSVGDSAETEPEVKEEDEQMGPLYYPVILCGDFNAEPNSPLYDFVTKGYLDYKNHLCRYISGQLEGLKFGRNILVPKSLIPSNLDITELCQYRHIVKERNRRLKKSTSMAINSGHAYHKMNFLSAYTPFIGKRGSPKAVTTYHERAACMVDYIFYSRELAGNSEKCKETSKHSPKSSDLRHQGASAEPEAGSGVSSEGSNSPSHNPKMLAKKENQPLVLLSRYRLLSSKEMSEVRAIPNRMFPSDHLCLLVKFMLR